MLAFDKGSGAERFTTIWSGGKGGKCGRITWASWPYILRQEKTDQKMIFLSARRKQPGLAPAAAGAPRAPGVGPKFEGGGQMEITVNPVKIPKHQLEMIDWLSQFLSTKNFQNLFRRYHFTFEETERIKNSLVEHLFPKAETLRQQKGGRRSWKTGRIATTLSS